MFFLNKLFNSQKKQTLGMIKQDTLDAAVRTLPEVITSPVWHIKGVTICMAM